MKITVYAICKNESAFVPRFVSSVSEADEIVVLDTGSTDQSVELLRSLGVSVYQKTITPWRFDEARNASLSLVSDDTDICVCMDLDEVFEPGWRKKLESAWSEGTTDARYTYIWSHEEGRAGVTFYGEKIHARHGFKWVHPVHEVLSYEGAGAKRTAFVPDIVVHHYPDESKSRSSYLPLLELAVSERPLDDRNTHYLGREYMFYGRYDEAIKALTRHLSLPSATWKDERAASMRYIARCFVNKTDIERAELWYTKAILENPKLREGYIEYAQLLFEQKDYYGCIFLLNKALSISTRTLTYISEPWAWGALPFDLLALCYYYTGNFPKALAFGKKACELSSEKRLKDNLAFYEKAINESN